MNGINEESPLKNDKVLSKPRRGMFSRRAKGNTETAGKLLKATLSSLGWPAQMLPGMSPGVSLELFILLGWAHVPRSLLLFPLIQASFFAISQASLSLGIPTITTAL